MLSAIGVAGNIGEGASRLVAMLCWRMLTALRREFSETRRSGWAMRRLRRLFEPMPAPQQPAGRRGRRGRV